MATAELPITGMTCASCANRIERNLNKLDGVTATVNYATEKASVDYDASAVAPEQLVAAVEAGGYPAGVAPAAREQLVAAGGAAGSGAVLPAAAAEEPPADADETIPVRNRLIASALLS